MLPLPGEAVAALRVPHPAAPLHEGEGAEPQPVHDELVAERRPEPSLHRPQPVRPDEAGLRVARLEFSNFIHTQYN